MRLRTVLGLAPAIALALSGCALAGGAQTQGQRMLGRGDLKGAVNAYSQAIDQGDHVAIAYANRCYAESGLDKNPEAIADCTKALDMLGEPSADEDKIQYAEILNNRGVAHINIHEYQQAIDDFDAALALRDDYTEAYANRGRAYVELENYEAARSDLDKCLELDSTLDKCYGNYAAVWTALGDVDKALEYYGHAIDNGHSTEAIMERASFLYSLGCFADAYADYQDVADNSDDDYVAFMAKQQADFLKNWNGDRSSIPAVCPSSDAKAGGETSPSETSSQGEAPSGTVTTPGDAAGDAPGDPLATATSGE